MHAVDSNNYNPFVVLNICTCKHWPIPQEIEGMSYTPTGTSSNTHGMSKEIYIIR
mgnify:CR=1 FL=1